jgi:hypothetical protein
VSFKVEAGVPVAPRQSRTVIAAERVRNSKYPFHSMNVGDSFAAPLDQCQNIRSAACKAKELTGKTFTVRRMPTEARCWRVS